MHVEARIYLIEDDPTILSFVTQALAGRPGWQLVGHAGSVVQALQMAPVSGANVFLVDLGLPDGSGIDVIRAAHQRWPSCHVMVSTIFGDEYHVLQSIEAGAHGYLLKDSPAETMADEIRLLHAGGSPVSPMIARLILSRLRADGPQASDQSAPARVPARSGVTMSPRETEVLELFTKGFTYEEIAQRMGVTRHTVQTFVRRIYAKLEVGSKIEAINAAREQGLLRV